ncbi:GGDEF domain-containing protein [Massilia sp. MS-15]|uniref:GGDEF domain-containing response regulator n=1 Tax=Massilia sp. MS-15 TaxID=2878200 RepID=UPI001CD3DAD1|nr:GGDEF domain-containing protein [Massilia sp. MS-15]MCA1245757.1 GGDEF domain-containing protein [Massilia sp. MS-15]
MSEQEGVQRPLSGVYLNPAAPRRAAFAQACAGLFTQLRLAGDAGDAARLLAQAPDSLLVLDLDGFEIGIDLAALGELVAARAGAPVLVLCPFAGARWLAALMAYGPLSYLIEPLAPEALRRELGVFLRAGVPEAEAADPCALLAVRAAAQAALAEADVADEGARFGARLCAALLGWPGVCHASLFGTGGGPEPRLRAQGAAPSAAGIDLQAIVDGSARVAPLQHAFPGLLAATSGETVLLDDPDKAHAPQLAAALRGHGVRMVLGLPLPGAGPGAPRGALCLMFGVAQRFGRAQLATLSDLAQLAAFGLRTAELARENEALLGRVTELATRDALTGMANRRHGECLLEGEIRRARRYRLPLALIAFDLDRFRNVNDAYGHPVGDIVLRTVAATARALLRSSDVLVRTGGEDFQVIAPHTSAVDGLRMAEKLRAAIADAVIPGCDHVTVSLGVAQLGETESADSLVVRVNAALARAKRAGRNCVELAMQ